jgi:gentisate 1,2-dioxygenase
VARVCAAPHANLIGSRRRAVNALVMSGRKCSTFSPAPSPRPVAEEYAMSTAVPPETSAADDGIRKAWQAAHVQPLWENAAAHNQHKQAERGHIWTWSTMQPLVAEALQLKSLAAIERRVLTLTPPQRQGHTTTNLTAALQILKPGETARPHRHSMNALRFVLDGSGAETVVNGKSCAMSEGDLVITPAMSWHEHIHRGDRPIVWLDALDAPLHRYFGTDRFEPGPATPVADEIDDAAFGAPNIVPELSEPLPLSSPVFRYPWDTTAKAVSSAPIGRDGARRVRYVNPLTGGAAMPLLDCYLTEIASGSPTTPFRTTANAVCVVAEGSGSTQVGDATFHWQRRDIISLPHGNWISHQADGAPAKLFVVTDREVLRRLDLLVDEYGNQVAG